VVLAFTTPEMVDLLPRAVEVHHVVANPFLFVLLSPVGAYGAYGPEGTAASLLAELRFVVQQRWAEPDPFKFMAAMGDAGHPIFVLIRHPAGLNGTIVDALLSHAPPGVTFLVPVTRAKGPDQWRADLASREMARPAVEVAGPDLAHGWDAFVDTEEKLVDDAEKMGRMLDIVYQNSHR
jgi:hypothetical protein